MNKIDIAYRVAAETGIAKEKSRRRRQRHSCRSEAGSVRGRVDHHSAVRFLPGTRQEHAARTESQDRRGGRNTGTAGGAVQAGEPFQDCRQRRGIGKITGQGAGSHEDRVRKLKARMQRNPSRRTSRTALPCPCRALRGGRATVAVDFLGRCGAGAGALRMRRWRRGFHGRSRRRCRRAVAGGQMAAVRRRRSDASHDRRTGVRCLAVGGAAIDPQGVPGGAPGWPCRYRQRSRVTLPGRNTPDLPGRCRGMLARRLRPGAACRTAPGQSRRCWNTAASRSPSSRAASAAP